MCIFWLEVILVEFVEVVLGKLMFEWGNGLFERVLWVELGFFVILEFLSV